MIRLPVVLAATLLCSAIGLTPPASSQEWSDAQKEVWAALEKTWELAEARDWGTLYDDFTHPDFSWWNYALAVPGNRAAARNWDKETSKNSKVLVSELVPLQILAYDTFAVVHYYHRQTSQNVESGESSFRESRWTDVFKKEGDKWLTVANHWGNVDALK